MFAIFMTITIKEHTGKKVTIGNLFNGQREHFEDTEMDNLKR